MKTSEPRAIEHVLARLYQPGHIRASRISAKKSRQRYQTAHAPADALPCT